MKRINWFLAVILLLSLAMASQAVAYQYQAPVSMGLLTDGSNFSLVKLGAYDGNPIQPEGISISGWTSETGSEGWDIFLNGVPSQNIAGFLHANEQDPILHLTLYFIDVSGAILSGGSYNSDSNSWITMPMFSNNSFFTIGQFQPVPEPASAVLMGAGLVMLVLGRRKCRPHNHG